MFAARQCQETRNSLTYSVDDSSCSGLADTMGTTVACNTQACPQYYYDYGVWTVCTTACSSYTQGQTIPGVQQRSATCMEAATGAVAVDVSCNSKVHCV